jgi:aspartyl-tRNA(Asn)/glutamyl-tRNA(Gln) amidotransferase subunit A
MSISKISEQIRTGTVSPVELTAECLARIEQLNPILNAFITVTADSALSEARQAEDEIRHGNWRGPLHGIPLALKDLIDTAGVRTTAASGVFKDRIPDQDAEVTIRLKRAGAILLGKQNLHEFAYGGSSMISFFGEVRNPWNPEHITGGSSGGSAAAVASGMCYGAIGTDTAGSIREPAALCGVAGLKPTYGRVSSRGVIPLSWSLDHVGPIARTVADAAVIFAAITGYDEHDATSANVPVAAIDLVAPVSNFRIGVPRRFFYEELDPEVASALEHALGVLKTFATEIREIEVAIPTDRTVQSAESYAYHRERLQTEADLYQPETLRRIRAGENITAADYILRRQELEYIRRDVAQVFDNLEVLVTPTMPTPAPAIAELKSNPELLRPREILLLRNTRPINVWGLPAISVPCGFTQSGLPIGMQIIGPHWREDRVLQLAYAYEQATAWHKRSPALPKISSPSAHH